MPDEDNPLLFERHPRYRLGVAFCSAPAVTGVHARDRLVDDEIYIVSSGVKSALEEKGFQVDLIDLGKSSIDALNQFDWVFNLAETSDRFPYTEYEVAEYMERHGIGFTGSGSEVLKVCLDKALTKATLLQAGMNTPAYRVISPGEPVRAELPFPQFVKPLHEDGSLGISDQSIVHNPMELRRRVSVIHRLYNQPALVEEYIEGRDILASVLGNGAQAVVLPLSECAYTHYQGPSILTFEAKWIPTSTPYQTIEAICPCSLEPEIAQGIREMALQVCRILGCRDYISIDFRLTGSTPYILDVNANPCINPLGAGFVTAGKAAGFSYTGLVTSILEASFERRGVYSPAD